MGNHFRKLVLAPDVPEQRVQALAAALRSRQRSPITLVICDLKDKKPRSEHLRSAQALGVRQIEIDGHVSQQILCEICDVTLGASQWLYREQDDEALDVCIPGPEWLERVYGATSLAWLLEIEEKPISWNKETLYAFPGNPQGWGVDVPVNARLLQVVQPNESRPCPKCAEVYASKRADRCQCPHCAYVAMPFASREDARRVEIIPLDAFSWGRCARCQKSMQFTNRIEQCQRCGRLLKATSRHDLELHENAEVLESLVAEWMEGV